jgi:hypothetical protein
MKPSFLQKLRLTYERWILLNTDSVRHIETLLKGSLFFLPGRFKEQELTSELVTGSVSIFGIFNDAVWLKKAKELGKHQSASSTSQWPGMSIFGSEEEGMKYERIRELAEGEKVEEGKVKKEELPGWAKDLHPPVLNQLKSIFQRSPATLLKNTGIHLILGLINESELLLELFAHALQETFETATAVTSRPILRALVTRLRGTVILFVELVKASLRLVLLWRNGGRTLTQMAIPSREDTIALSGVSNDGDEDDEDATGSSIPIPTLPPHMRPRYERFTLDRIAEVKRRATPTAPTGDSILGEIMWILRPVIYVFLRIRYGRTWTPWITSFLIDVISQRLSKRDNLSEPEKDELSRRRSILLLYVLRSPFYEVIQQLFSPATNFAYHALGRIPGMQVAWDFISELLTVYRNRYFYLAGSGSP